MVDHGFKLGIVCQCARRLVDDGFKLGINCECARCIVAEFGLEQAIAIGVFAAQNSSTVRYPLYSAQHQTSSSEQWFVHLLQASVGRSTNTLQPQSRALLLTPEPTFIQKHRTLSRGKTFQSRASNSSATSLASNLPPSSQTRDGIYSRASSSTFETIVVQSGERTSTHN